MKRNARAHGVRRGAPSAVQESPKLHKFLAEAGLGSRRVMEQWIREGRVTVNGVVAGVGLRARRGDVIKIGRHVVPWPAPRRLPRVLLYHKPAGEIVSRDDPEGRDTVFAKLPRLRGAKWVAIGRLDFNTSGLLIFTDDGGLANRLMHPRFDIEREYAVRVRGQLLEQHLAALRAGVMLDDGIARFSSVNDSGGEGANRWYHVVLREGRNRIVRRTLEKLGLTVSRLIRVRFGPIGLPPRLTRGRSRELTPTEVEQLIAWLESPAASPTLPVVPVTAGKHNRPRRSSAAR